MSQNNKIHWTVKLGAIAVLLTALGTPVLFPDLIKIFWQPDPVSPIEDLVIIVKDSETKETLDNAEIEITYKKGIIPGRTLDDGTYRLQIPPQDLGTVKILVKKEGYQQTEIPKDFSVNPNEPLTIYLESGSHENPDPPVEEPDNPVPSPPVSPNPEDTSEDLEITVRDSETKETLNNADIKITYEKSIISGRTLDDGTYKLPIPPQKLGAVKILVKKERYQQTEIPKDFSVNPNEPLTIYLEQEPYTVPQESYYTVPPESYK